MIYSMARYTRIMNCRPCCNLCCHNVNAWNACTQSVGNIRMMTAVYSLHYYATVSFSKIYYS